MTVIYVLSGFACGAVTMYAVMRRKISHAFTELRALLRTDPAKGGES